MNLSHLLRLILNVLIFLLVAQQVYARVDYDKTQPLILPDSLKDSNLSSTVNAIMPKNDLSGFTQKQVASKILDNSIRYLWRTSPLRYTSVGQVANKVEKSVQVQKVIKATEEDKIEHKFSFDIQGIQALAQLKYTGWIKAAIQYNMNDASASAEVSEKVFENKDLVLSQTVGAADTTSQLSLRWDW